MWPVLKLICSLLISCLTLCYAIQKHSNTTIIQESQMKMYLVEEIVKKVCNMSLNMFSNKSPAEKAALLIKVEEKLNNSARVLGVHGTKYVDLIMKGVKLKASENNQVKNYKLAVEISPASEYKQVTDNNSNLVQSLRTRKANVPVLRADYRFDPKSGLVNNISTKVELIARGMMKGAKNEKERESMMEYMKKYFFKSASSKNAISHKNKDELKSFVDLVTKGIDLAMKRDEARRRRMEFAYTDIINISKNSQDSVSYLSNITGPAHLRNNEIDDSESKPKPVFLINSSTTFKPMSSCSNTLLEVCEKIRLLKTLRCQIDNKEFNILKLCDGVGDCLDFSDENHCGSQVIETIQSASRIIGYIDTSINAHHCLPDLLDKSMLAKQNTLLSDVLKSQFNFLEKYSQRESKAFSRRVFNTEKSAISQAVHEAVNVIDSLTSALGISICPEFRKDATNSLDIDDLEKETLQESYSHKNNQEICKCNGPNCQKKCSPRCKTICFDMFSLSQFSCEAINGGDMVSLDMLCDDKLDCYDELDEKDCSDIAIAKFEATHMYDYVLKEIQAKTASVTYEALRLRLRSLYTLVVKLQKLSLKREPDVPEVKRVRRACFEELSKVYDSALISMKNDEEQITIRFFLITLNERLISALKRSNTGNSKIISSDGCVCRNNKCVLQRCTKSCIRACAAESQLTRFTCSELSKTSNDSIPVELVCNGKENCPNGDDEKDCKREVCRSHHFVVLRRKLHEVGKKYSGTALGEALRSWRIKVTSTLMVAESNERPSPAVRYDVVRDMLQDLVMAYATVEDRRENVAIFKEFHSWSRVVIDSLKDCTK